MFNMVKIGHKIAELRKTQNMTQMELADRMNISFQAVSNWERGNSMPDISKLPELAKIFAVSIDEIIGEKNELIENVVNNRTDEYIKQNVVNTQEFITAAPILKPEQADIIFENKVKSMNLSEIAGIAPFISRDIIDKLALKAFENPTPSMNLSEITGIAPFVSSDVIDKLALKAVESKVNICEIAPFISTEIINKIAVDGYNKYGIGYIEDILPFISKNVLNEIAGIIIKKYDVIDPEKGLCHLETLVPFLDSAYLNEIAKNAINKYGINAISPIAPFLDKKMLSEYVIEKYL